MPRWASRLTLIVTATKIERLQDISDIDCEREGLRKISFAHWDCNGPVDNTWHTAPTGRDCFRWLWVKLHSEESWKANPEVVALSFTTHRCNIDVLPKEITA